MVLFTTYGDHADLTRCGTMELSDRRKAHDMKRLRQGVGGCRLPESKRFTIRFFRVTNDMIAPAVPTVERWRAHTYPRFTDFGTRRGATVWCPWFGAVIGY